MFHHTFSQRWPISKEFHKKEIKCKSKSKAVCCQIRCCQLAQQAPDCALMTLFFHSWSSPIYSLSAPVLPCWAHLGSTEKTQILPDGIKVATAQAQAQAQKVGFPAPHKPSFWGYFLLQLTACPRAKPTGHWEMWDVCLFPPHCLSTLSPKAPLLPLSRPLLTRPLKSVFKNGLKASHVL